MSEYSGETYGRGIDYDVECESCGGLDDNHKPDCDTWMEVE